MPQTFYTRVAVVLSVLLLFGGPMAMAVQPDTSDVQPLSLDDLAALDALIEEDAEAVTTIDGSVLLDVAVLGLVLLFAVISFLRKSDSLKVVSLLLSVGYLGFVKASLVSVTDIFGALHRNLPAFQGGQAY